MLLWIDVPSQPCKGNIEIPAGNFFHCHIFCQNIKHSLSQLSPLLSLVTVFVILCKHFCIYLSQFLLFLSLFWAGTIFALLCHFSGHTCEEGRVERWREGLAETRLIGIKIYIFKTILFAKTRLIGIKINIFHPKLKKQPKICIFFSHWILNKIGNYFGYSHHGQECQLTKVEKGCVWGAPWRSREWRESWGLSSGVLDRVDWEGEKEKELWRVRAKHEEEEGFQSMGCSRGCQHSD